MRKEGSTLLIGCVFVLGMAMDLRASGTLLEPPVVRDAYIRSGDAEWVMGTATVERKVVLKDGRLLLESFKHKKYDLEMIPDANGEPVFSFLLADDPKRITSKDGAWILVNSKQSELRHGELQLDITVKRNSLEATKSYVVYPGTSVIREWVSFKNVGADPLTVVAPTFLDARIRLGAGDGQDFYWMTGGANKPGSWRLKKETLAVGTPHEFDSFDAFPADFPGDGPRMNVSHNDKAIWGARVANAETMVPIDVAATVKAGDRIVLALPSKWNAEPYDLCSLVATVRYEDGETHAAAQEFSGEQGRNGWSYCYVQDNSLANLTYSSAEKEWRMAGTKPGTAPFIRANEFCPATTNGPALVWTAKRAGQIRVTGSVCNIANKRGLKPPRAFNWHGSGSYAPWFSLFDAKSRAGLFVGWDYFGHWSSKVERTPTEGISIPLTVAAHKQTLAPGHSFSTPKAFVGLYGEDLDNAGNECLDWQYRYLWDYTRQREGWFPAIRMLGYWIKGTSWNPGGKEWTWTGALGDLASTERKVFRVADLIRYCGADVYHRDWGWWDRAGDWNGPDWRAINEYLRKSNVGLLVYAFMSTVAADSKVAQEHPDWLTNQGPMPELDMSMPEVRAFLKSQLNAFVARRGDFMWRNDNQIISRRNDDESVLLGQDQGFREILRDFLESNPGCAFQACNGGGYQLGYEYVGYSSCISMSDGAVGLHSNYHLSLLIPPDKTAHIPDVWDPNNYNKTTWRAALAFCLDMTGDTWDPGKLEGVRTLVDIYHYLHSQGVVGRYVKVHRPTVTGDDPEMYYQRLSGDRRRGIVVIKHLVPGPIVVKLKGLLPSETYFVSFQESVETSESLGSDLMNTGITLQKVPAGELIYLNLPMHPGSKLDTLPPGPPTKVAQGTATNLGYPGIELTWSPGSDNNWISYYEILRNGVVIDKVAKGTYYFDHSLSADLAARYEVRAVDGAGNVSSGSVAEGRVGKPSTVFDNANTAIRYKGEWQQQTGLLPADGGTISSSDRKGDALELQFEGKRVLWFAKMGPECGQALVSADGVSKLIDTYSADDIWGACVYEREFPTAGPHTLRVEVLGQPTGNVYGIAPAARKSMAGHTKVCVDGFRAEFR